MMSALGQYGEKIHKKVKNAVEIAAAEQQRLRLSKGLLHLAARMERPKAIGRTQSQSENRGLQALHAPRRGRTQTRLRHVGQLRRRRPEADGAHCRSGNALARPTPRPRFLGRDRSRCRRETETGPRTG